MKYLFVGLLLSGLVTGTFSCSQKKCEECELDKVKNDTIQSPNNMQEALMRDTAVTTTKETKENHEKIVAKFGEQWDFCSCIVRLDSITDAFEKKLTPTQEEKLMARWDYVDQRCKEVTTFDNTTPDERIKHEKRVNKCLKQNGLKK